MYVTPPGVVIFAGLVSYEQGRPQIVTAPGPGDPARIKVFHYDLFTPTQKAVAGGAAKKDKPGDPTKVAEFLAYDEAYTGGISLTTGWVAGEEGGAQSIITGQLMVRMKRYRYLGTFGMVVMVFGLYLLAQVNVGTAEVEVVRDLVLVGLGVGVGMPLYLNATQSAVDLKYLGVVSMELHLLGAIVASVLVTAVFGVACVRYTRIFFGILTMALSQVLWSLAFKFFWVTGGTDGLRVPTPTLLGVVTGKGDKIAFLAHAYYYYVLALFLVCAAIMWLIVNSPFGRALQAIRDNETRAQFIGIPIWRYRWVAFMLSGVFTGVAGALWVPLNGLTTPDILHWTFSGKIVFMAVLGGFRTFVGPIVGAVVYNYLESYAVGYTVYWQLFLGVILVVLVLSLPTGIVGTAERLLGRRREAAQPQGASR